MIERVELKSGYIVVDVPVGMGGSIHQLYVKEHSGRDAMQESSNSSSSSTLFVGNVDLCLEMSHQDIDAYLREMMSNFGTIEAVYVSAIASDVKRRRNRSDDDANDQSDSDDDEGTAINNGVETIQHITTNRSRFAHVVFKKKSDMKSFLNFVKLQV